MLRLLLGLFVLSSVRADEQWILTTADFKSETVALRSIDEQAIQIPGTGGDERTIPMAQFLQLDRVGASRATLPRMYLWLTDGDRIGGAPVGLSGESLTWKCQTLGELSFPLKQIRAIQRSGQAAPRNDLARTEDVLTLGNGDSLRGIVSDITASAVSIQTAGADAPMVIPIASLLALDLASAPGSTTAPVATRRSFRVTTGDGSVLTTESVKLNQRELTVRLPDSADRPVPLSSISGIEQVNGPVIWLSACVPSESVQIPSFSQRTLPAQMDKTVLGEPIRVDDREFAHGIGVHSYSRLVFPIEPSCDRFRTQFAIDGEQPWADVTVRVKLDDRVAFEKTNVASGTISDVVKLDLNGAKTLTLEVDYGENYDVQDRFSWIEPALLRK